MKIGAATDGSSAATDAEAPTREGGDATDGSSATSDEEAPTDGSPATSDEESPTPEDGDATDGIWARSDEEASTDGGSATSNEETGCRPSLNSLALVRKAIPRMYISSDDINDWRHVVYKGVLLENNTQKFWVDAKFHKNCFLVLPKACDIAGGDEERCWSWITKEEKCFPTAVDIPILKSKELSWLFIQGRFETRALSPETTYEVAFVVKPKRDKIKYLTGELYLPKRSKKCFSWSAGRRREEGWDNVPAGQFTMGPKTVGTIRFVLEMELNLKEGDLILGGVLIHPKD